MFVTHQTKNHKNVLSLVLAKETLACIYLSNKIQQYWQSGRSNTTVYRPLFIICEKITSHIFFFFLFLSLVSQGPVTLCFWKTEDLSLFLNPQHWAQWLIGTGLSKYTPWRTLCSSHTFSPTETRKLSLCNS